MKIPKDNLKEYDQQVVDLLTKEMNELINNEIISSFDLLYLLKNNYVNNFNNVDSLILDYNQLRVNCIYLTNKLKNIATTNNIKTYYVFYQANGLSTKSGDKIIRKGHVALLYLSKRKNQIFYTIFDTGMQITKPIQFYEKHNYNNGNIHVYYNANYKYPYTFIMNNYIYLNKSKFKITLRFNPNYTYSLNHIFDYNIFKIMTGYKILNYKKKCYIKILPIYKKLSYGIGNVQNNLTYEEIREMGKDNLKIKLLKCMKYLYLDDSFIDLIMFMIKHDNEFITNVLDKRVVYEYLEGKYL
jgi:hypothetical protein